METTTGSPFDIFTSRPLGVYSDTCTQVSAEVPVEAPKPPKFVSDSSPQNDDAGRNVAPSSPRLHLPSITLVRKAASCPADLFRMGETTHTSEDDVESCSQLRLPPLAEATAPPCSSFEKMRRRRIYQHEADGNEGMPAGTNPVPCSSFEKMRRRRNHQHNICVAVQPPTSAYPRAPSAPPPSARKHFHHRSCTGKD